MKCGSWVGVEWLGGVRKFEVGMLDGVVCWVKWGGWVNCEVWGGVRRLGGVGRLGGVAEVE